MKIPQLTAETVLVLRQFLERPGGWRYGYELLRPTQLTAGTLYPILYRLARYAVLETRSVVTHEGVPPRRDYRLTADGLEFVRSKLPDARTAPTHPQPARVAERV